MNSMDLQRSRTSTKGYSLVEMLVAVSMASVLAGVGIPAMNGYIKNDRLAVQINTLAGDLALARSVAISRHQSVVLCASDDQASCSSENWAEGWIVFVDMDSDTEVDDDDELIGQSPALGGENKLSGSMGDKVVYDARGFAPDTLGNFVLCDDRGDEYMKSMVIERTGRFSSGGNGSC